MRRSDLCFIDLETTGHIFGFHEVIDIAVLRTAPDGQTIIGQWQRRLRPMHPERISPIAQQITGFSAQQWSDAEPHSTAVWTEFADFCRGAVPVCHNPTFDRAHVTLAAAAAGVHDLGLDYHWIGTESLAWPLYKNGVMPRLSLEELCRHFGIHPEPKPHTAMNGARTCRDIYLALMHSPSLDLPALLAETGALLSGHFRLSSGLHSPNYVQCAKLLEHPRNAKAIGAALGERVRRFGARKVVAPALGGVIIGYTVAEALDVPSIFTERKDGAMTLRRGFAIEPGEKVVIVEDVVTTGKSTRETAAVIEQCGGVVAGFASILNRSGKENPFDAPYEALMSLVLETYDEAACPLCKGGVPLDAPGSRYSQRSS